jgi:hypothetical protein
MVANAFKIDEDLGAVLCAVAFIGNVQLDGRGDPLPAL